MGSAQSAYRVVSRKIGRGTIPENMTSKGYSYGFLRRINSLTNVESRQPCTVSLIIGKMSKARDFFVFYIIIKYYTCT